jgi:hypothetical protein
MGSWRWAALLGFALLAPVGLPAGGAGQPSAVVRRRLGRHEPLLSGDSDCLRCAPQHQAPPLAELPSGIPLRLLRRWCDQQGSAWLQVEGRDGRGCRRRGWLEVQQAA